MIHPTAVIDSKARIGTNVSIGPYTVIGADVEIGDGTWIGPHVVINGPTRIGRDNKIFQFSSLGEVPQDKKYGGEPTTLEIGDRNVIREGCTFNRGTVQDRGYTRIGNDNWIMAYVHLAHDCVVGNNTIFANNTSLAGHVIVDDHVVLGGFTLILQFCRVGQHAFTSFASMVQKDIPPYVTVSGHWAKPYGLNTEGMRRRGFSKETMEVLRKAYKIIYRSNLRLEEALQELAPLGQDHAEVQAMIDFISKSERGIAR